MLLIIMLLVNMLHLLVHMLDSMLHLLLKYVTRF
jgi:hypothetical protein